MNVPYFGKSVYKSERLETSQVDFIYVSRVTSCTTHSIRVIYYLYLLSCPKISYSKWQSVQLHGPQFKIKTITDTLKSVFFFVFCFLRYTKSKTKEQNLPISLYIQSSNDTPILLTYSIFTYVTDCIPFRSLLTPIRRLLTHFDLIKLHLNRTIRSYLIFTVTLLSIDYYLTGLFFTKI